MQKKLESLTVEQKAKLESHLKKWLAIELYPGPTKRELAEEGITEAYYNAGLKEPQVIIWCGSPFALFLTWQVLTSGVSLERGVRGFIGDNLEVPVSERIIEDIEQIVTKSNLREYLGESLKDRVIDLVKSDVCERVLERISGDLFDDVSKPILKGFYREGLGRIHKDITTEILSSFKESLWDNIYESIGASGCNSYEIGWLAYYDFFRAELGLVKETEKLSGLWKIVQAVNWYIFCEKLCLVSQRHNLVRLDEQSRLHNENGLVLGYPDGWGCTPGMG